MFAKRITAFISCLLIVCLCSGALAEPMISTHGAFATKVFDMVYASFDTGSEYSLYGVDSAAGSATGMQLLATAPEIGDLVSHDGILYFLQSDASTQSVMKLDGEGNISTLSDFEVDVEVSHLSWYDDVLYAIANNRLYIIDPNNGEAILLCDELMDEYVIVDDVIYFVSASDTYSYDKDSPNKPDAKITQSSGALWSMSSIGTNPKRLLDKGVTNLRAVAGNLYFHNLEDNYIIGAGDNLWLEGKLYRYNIETSQMSSLNIPYDWDYYPTDSGLLIYSSEDISLYPLTGGDATNLMKPELSSNVTANGSDAFVYEYDSARLSLLPLDGTAAKVLSEGENTASLTTPGNEDEQATSGSKAAVSDSNGEFADQSYDEETNTVKAGTSATYIFPNSSIKKLTREQIKMVDKSLWGYARNEIYARHGYQYNNGKYSTYFSSKSWYKPGGFSSSSLSSIEWYNMELFKELENEEGLISSSSKSSGDKSGKNNYYILKEASSRKLTKKYIRKKLGSRSKYALARNEILARHGYVFKTKKYRNYFNNQSWYSPGGYSSSRVSNIEWYNIEQLKELEAGW